MPGVVRGVVREMVKKKREKVEGEHKKGGGGGGGGAFSVAGYLETQKKRES